MNEPIENTYIFDGHVHSTASGHAFSTLEEIILQSKKKGLKAFALTDHGPAMLGSQTKIYFELLPELEDEYDGIVLLKGIEVNILDNGELDLEDRFLRKLDWVIASSHDACLESKGVEENTKIIRKVLDNPYIDVLGHLGNEQFKVDYENVVQYAKEKIKLLS